jgi:prepilin-type N-terminal cleavage/methylation domain-containing protein
MLKKNQKEKGFSIIELCCVMAIILVLSSVSLFYLSSNKKLYAADDQALLLSDILQEAKQKAFTQKEIMRVEINQTTKRIRLIEENLPNALPATAVADDRVVKEIPFYGSEVVRLETNPTNVTTLPVDVTPTPQAVFVNSTYPSSLGNSVCTIRFLRSGIVTNGGTLPDASDAVPTGLTIHIWKPTTPVSTTAIVGKAITIGSGTGTVRLWNYNMSNNTWVNARYAL